METKEELLKIYSAYLPYELKFISCDAPMLKNAWVMVGVKLNERFSDTILSKREDYKNTINISTNTAKPILYSMDMLTKEIEHKGERFIPLKRITLELYDKTKESVYDDESKYKIIDERYCYPSNGERTSRFWLEYKSNMMAFDSQDNESCLPQYMLFQKLLEWHFNVFGLEENEYIKKQSVIQK